MNRIDRDWEKHQRVHNKRNLQKNPSKLLSENGGERDDKLYINRKFYFFVTQN